MISKRRLRLLRIHGRLAKWIPPSEARSGLLAAAIVGCLAGLSAIVFREAIQGVLWLWTRHTGSLEEVAEQLPWWQRFIIPAAGGLLAGLVLQFGARFGQGEHSTDYMEAVAIGQGVMGVRKGLTKALSSLLTISSGGSIGREGAMIQISAIIASLLGLRARLSTPRLRLIVACGAAGGLAAVYNVTVASALFVSEIVLGSIAVESLGPLLVAALASSFVSRYVGRAEPYFTSPAFQFVSPLEIIPYAITGMIVGIAAPAYVWLLRQSEEWMTKLVPRGYWRVAFGGLIVGALAFPFPQVWGNGRTMVNLVLSNPWPAATLSAILLCKVAATAATTGSGAVGGVFTPTLFTGVMLGCLCGHGVAAVWPALSANPQAYALVGMAGFLAATTRAPLMAMTMTFGMTLDTGIALPLISVCVIAYYTARSLHGDSIYSESLRRKQPPTVSVDVSALRVRDLVKPAAASVTENTPLDEIMRRFVDAPYHHLLVVTLQNRLRGVITLTDVEDKLQCGQASDWLKAAGLMQPISSVLTPDMMLSDALAAFRHFKGERLPVVDNLDERRLQGVISKTDVLLALAHGLSDSAH